MSTTMMNAVTLQEQIQSAFIEWIEADPTNNTAAEMARRSGVNKADLSHIRTGKSTRKTGKSESPIPRETYLRLAQALGVQVQQGVVHWEAATIHQTIQELCYVAHVNRRFTLVDGPSGIGKTYSLQHYQRRNSKVVYIQATKHMSGVDLLTELLTKFGQEKKLPTSGNRSKRLHTLHREIADFVSKNPGWLVILDEMEDKSKDLYQAVKDLCDDFGRERQHRKCGLLLCGIGLYDAWRKKHLSGQMPYTQLYTRFTEHYKPLLQGSTSDEVSAFIRKEVRNLAAADGYTHPTALSWIEGNIDSMGALNSLITDLNRLCDEEGVERAQITATIISEYIG